MKKLFLLANLLMAFGISADAGDITSPNGQIKVNFTLDGTVPTYSVTYQGKTIIKPSRLGYYLEAEPMEYITAARKAKGSDNWFVGGVTGMKAHQSTVKLDFLDKGKKYVATIYQDAKNADYKTNPQAYVITKKTVTSKSILKLNSVAGGGFAISILAQ